MEQHPIPQDVTGFQFKLIGTMTVKQFGYVASGVVMAVILYYLPLNSVFGVLLKVLLIPFLGSSGVIVAFVPIDGRPIDVMTTNFMKAVFSPNQYVYRRQGRQLSFSMVSVAKTPAAKKTQQKAEEKTQVVSKHLDEKEEKLRALLMSSRGRVKNDIDKREAAFLNTLTLPSTSLEMAPVAVHAASPQPILQPIMSLQQDPMPQHAPVIKPIIKQVAQAPVSQPAHPAPQNSGDDLTKKESELEQELSKAKQEDTLSNTPETHIVAQQKVAILSKQIDEVHARKQQLEQELSHLKTQLATQKGTPPSPQPVQPSNQPIQDPQHVRAISQEGTKKVGLPHISDSPNVVVGIVKDPRGNILPHILVEVKDKDGNPVRAFKTNQLGQFASATPLSPGTYTIELEDPKKQQRFDIIQIVANNQILLPIEIISHDAREELRKQLFAN
jgi:PrgI family protein